MLNRRFTYRLLLLFPLMLICLSAMSQKKKSDLENKKKQLQEEIEYTNKLLEETKKDKKISLNQLVTLNKKISAREELINTINSEILSINRQIVRNNTEILVLQEELQRLKNDYAKMVYGAYKNQDAYSKLMFVFAASDFDQAYLRLKYFQQYTAYRKQQAEEIKNKQTELNEKIKELEVRKEEKRELLGTQEVEKQNLTKEKSEKETVLTTLQSKEKELKKDLDKKRKDAEKLEAAIKEIIRQELLKAQKAAEKEGGKVPVRLLLTPEAQQLSSSFASNKGKLPWPVIQGVIVDRFGTYPHPSLKDVTISNNGVDIATSKGALARAVFDGEVTGVVNIPSSGQVVIVRHGEYLSVYANLKEVYVKQGEKIKTKQNIGNILHNGDEGQTELHIEIWKGQEKLNPEEWLFKN